MSSEYRVRDFIRVFKETFLQEENYPGINRERLELLLEEVVQMRLKFDKCMGGGTIRKRNSGRWCRLRD